MYKIIILQLLVSASVLAQYNPSEDLRQTFCPSQGEFTRASINHTDALRGIVVKLRDDVNCNSISAGTQNLIDSLASLEELESNNSQLGIAELKLDKYEQELSVLKANFINQYTSENTNATSADISLALDNFIATDSMASAFSSKVTSLTLDTIDLQLEYGFNQEDKRVDDKKKRLKAIGSNLKAVMGQLKVSSLCTNNNALLKTNALSLITGLAATFMTNPAGTAVSLGAGLISSMSDLVNNISANTKLNKLRDADFMDSIGCSYLGMANTYCSAKDARTLVQKRYLLKTNPDLICKGKECTSLVQGLKIKNKKIRVLNTWIDKLFAGANPIDLNAARPKTQAEDLRASFAKVKIVFNAIFSDAQRDLRLAQTQKEKANIVDVLLTDINTQILINNGFFDKTGNNNVPYANIFAVDRQCGPYAYIFSDGLQKTLNPRIPNTPCLVNAKANFPSASISYRYLLNIIAKLNNEAQLFVSREVAKSTKVNSQEILKDFDDLSFGTTPRQVLLDIQTYISDLSSYLVDYSGEKKNLLVLIERMKEDISLAITKESKLKCERVTVDDSSTADSDSTDTDVITTSDTPESFYKKKIECDSNLLSSEKVEDLNNILAPSRENLYIQDAFNEILKSHIDIAVIQKDISDSDLINLMDGSVNNRLDVLSRYALSSSSVRSDANTAMSKTKVNVDVFSKLFDRELYKILKRLKSSDAEEDTQSFSRLCIASLVSKSDSRFFRKINRLCKGSVYKSMYPGDVRDISYDENFKKKYESRICTFYDYDYKVRFFEDRI